MNENNELLISYAENELLNKESIRREVLSGNSRRNVPSLRRILTPIAACFLALVIAVFAIPSARAAVLSWLGVSTPEEYLMQDPENRSPIETLDELIVSPAGSDAWRSNTGSVTDNRILFAADEAIWQRIADDFMIELGETLVDGESMYLTVRLHGLSALPELDMLTGGSATRTPVPNEKLPTLFPNGDIPEVFLDGEAQYMAQADSDIWLILEDGVELRFIGLTAFMNDEEVARFVSDVRDKYVGSDGWYANNEDQARISEETAEWLEGKALISAVEMGLDGFEEYGASDPLEFLSRYADGDGMLRAKAVYRAYAWFPSREKKLEVELGTACFDIETFRKLEKTPLFAESPAALSHHEAILSRHEWIGADGSGAYAVTNIKADLDGVRFTVKDGAYLNGLGVQNVTICVSFPDRWTKEQCEAFAQCLGFYAEAGGCRLDITSYFRKAAGEREYEFRFGHIPVPYEMIKDLNSLSIVPTLSCEEYYCTGDNTKHPMLIGETVIVPEGADTWFEGGEPTVLTDGAIELIKRK